MSAAAPLHIRSRALELRAREVPWDSASFGVAVAQVETIVVHDKAAVADEAQVLAAWLQRHRFMLAACRLADDRLAESFVLEALGFRFVEMVYTMQYRLPALPDPCEHGLSWTVASEQHLEQLQAMASGAFVTGRWNVDWRVGARLGGRRYADWVARSLQDPGHQVLLAMQGDAVAGYFVVEEKPDGEAYWHLTAVAEALQGRGVGRRMWRSMLQRLHGRGCKKVTTTIAARNLPVVNLYASLGWRFVQNQMTFHWASPDWRDPGASGGGYEQHRGSATTPDPPPSR